MLDEEEVPDESEVVVTEHPEANDEPEVTPMPELNIDIFFPIEEGVLEKLRVDQLRDELSIRDLSVRGKKN